MGDFRWQKSSYSGGASGNCVEIGWRKSSYSGGNSGNCVELAALTEATAIRDSKRPDGGHLLLSDRSWRGFRGELATGRLDLA